MKTIIVCLMIFMAACGVSETESEPEVKEESLPAPAPPPEGGADPTIVAPSGCDLYRGATPVECNPYFIDVGRPLPREPRELIKKFANQT